MDYDEAMHDVRRRFTSIENDLDLALHDLYGRLARMDLLTLPSVPPSAPGPDETVINLPAPVFGPRVVYGPITNPHAEPIIPAVVELHASLPWWRRVLRRLDRRFARDLEVSA